MTLTVKKQKRLKARIFALATEMPSAGHPLVGTHWTLAHLGRVELVEPANRVRFELEVGMLPAGLYVSHNEVQQVVMTQDRPTFHDVLKGMQDLALRLGFAAQGHRSRRSSGAGGLHRPSADDGTGPLAGRGAEARRR